MQEPLLGLCSGVLLKAFPNLPGLDPEVRSLYKGVLAAELAALLLAPRPTGALRVALPADVLVQPAAPLKTTEAPAFGQVVG